MLAGGATLAALVDVLGAVDAFEARGTRTHVCAVDGRSVADGAGCVREHLLAEIREQRFM